MKTYAEISIYLVDEKTGKGQLIAYNMNAQDAEALAAFAKKNLIKPTATSVFNHGTFTWEEKSK